MKGSCKSLVELEYHLEEVFKATTDQLDWVNPEGQQYPHNLLNPLPLIPNNQGRRVITFEHFINNELEYLRGGASSRKYTTSITKTKAADYGHIKDDDKLYKFKEGDFKRLRIQYIEDMLLLLVQGKLINLTVEECFAFNVSLRMFTRSIVIQRRVEDLQLGVESYQKKLNLMKPNTDGMLTDVRTALDDLLKGIRMSIQPWISELAKQADSRSSFNELMDTPLDFSNFRMNRFRVDTLTPELLAGPTYKLMKGSCKSLIELEYHLEEVYKATTDQLDWVNPEG
nr:hypothetical protein [Tanacetum cinerariifolium]